MRIGNTELQPVTKFLLFANIAVYLLMQIRPEWFGLLAAWFPLLDKLFIETQIVTHMFMHADNMHIFFNMFALFMFGNFLEGRLGSKRFLILYFFSGIGAYGLHLLSQFYDYHQLQQYLATSSNKTASYFLNFGNANEVFQLLKVKGWTSLLSPVVGASGCLYGVLAAYAYLFPNTELMLIFIPFPIKAKYFVPIMVGIDLLAGFNPLPMDNIAHFAHVGGALFGFLLVIFWNKYNKKTFY